MSATAIETTENAAGGPEPGITLLEAYSALVQRAGGHARGVEIPFPGRRLDADPESTLWSVRIRQYD